MQNDFWNNSENIKHGWVTLSTPKVYGNGEIFEVETSIETFETSKVEVSTERKYAIYYETADSDFKSRYKNDNMSFRNQNHLNDNELSK